MAKKKGQITIGLQKRSDAITETRGGITKGGWGNRNSPEGERLGLRRGRQSTAFVGGERGGAQSTHRAGRYPEQNLSHIKKLEKGETSHGEGEVTRPQRCQSWGPETTSKKKECNTEKDAAAQKKNQKQKRGTRIERDLGKRNRNLTLSIEKNKKTRSTQRSRFSI